MIKEQDDDDYSIIDRIYFYVKDRNEWKYQHVIKKCAKMVLQNLIHSDWIIS